jgi:hypothetical protein
MAPFVENLPAEVAEPFRASTHVTVLVCEGSR